MADGARYCSECGAAVVTAGWSEAGLEEARPGVTAVERDWARWPLLAGGLIVVVAAAVLAAGRMDDSSLADEPDPTAAVSSTSAPSAAARVPAPSTTAASTTAPSTTAAGARAPSTTGARTTGSPEAESAGPAPTAVGSVDVSAVPDELAGLTLILLRRDRSVEALDLGSGIRTSIETELNMSADSVGLWATPAGIVLVNHNGGRTTLMDWSFTATELWDGDRWVGGVFATGPDLWLMRYGNNSELIEVTDGVASDPVRAHAGWPSLVGTIDGDAMLYSPLTGATHRVTSDGTTTMVEPAAALAGGQDWLLVARCDQTITCATELVDLRSGRRQPMPLPLGELSQVDLIGTSADGRRAVIMNYPTRTFDEVVTAIIDADEMSMTEIPATVHGGNYDAFDATLRYSFTPLSGITITELTTGDAITLTLERPVQRVVAAPEGWQPPPGSIVAPTSTP